MEKELQDLKHQVQTLLAAANTSPALSTTLSLQSQKSKREVELESKILRLESLVGSQMEVIANLQKTMEALNAKLDHDGSDTSVTTNSYRKRVKTGPSPCKTNFTHAKLSSESDLDHEMCKPSDNLVDEQLTQPNKVDETTNMVDDERDINGGIQDDDISKTLLPNNNDDQDSNHHCDTISQAATQDDDEL